MGSGKTSWAINYINQHPDENILYITPYLDEVDRIKRCINRELKSPKNLGDGKLGNIQYLLENQEDIVSTHALFMKFDNTCKEAVKLGDYTLFLDETIAAVEPYNLANKDDIDYLLQKNSIRITPEGYIEWLDKDMDTRFNPIKILAQNHSLFYVNNKILLWRYPPEIFKLFKQVYVMTYMFDGSILKYYFDLCNLKYEIKSIKPTKDDYLLCEYYKPDKSNIRNKIHVYNKSDLNDCFTQKPSALSATWLRNPDNIEKIKKLKNATYNYFTNKLDAKSESIMWTTLESAKPKLQGKGYAKKFVACNCRATNDFSNTTNLAYLYNVYPNVGVSQFFYQHGIEINQDKYGLSEMLQWIWRSNIRCNGKINVFIPSKRMRKLLLDWLED